MKKTIAILLCAVLLLGLAACGAKNNASQTAGSEENQPEIVSNNITDTADMMSVESPIGTLYYPEKWKDDVEFQVTDTQVAALYYETPLFTIYFGGDKGDVYGTVQHDGEEITLRYELYDLDPNDADIETMGAMQDDINVIFYYLTNGEA